MRAHGKSVKGAHGGCEADYARPRQDTQGGPDNVLRSELRVLREFIGEARMWLRARHQRRMPYMRAIRARARSCLHLGAGVKTKMPLGAGGGMCLVAEERICGGDEGRGGRGDHHSACKSRGTSDLAECVRGSAWRAWKKSALPF